MSFLYLYYLYWNYFPHLCSSYYNILTFVPSAPLPFSCISFWVTYNEFRTELFISSTVLDSFHCSCLEISRNLYIIQHCSHIARPFPLNANTDRPTQRQNSQTNSQTKALTNQDIVLKINPCRLNKELNSEVPIS